MNNYFSVLSSTLIQAGEIVLKHRQEFNNAVIKEKNEIVTPADVDSNNYIISELTKSFPDIPIYSEEGNQKNESLTRWIIDPLDGTTPWVWGNSGFSISVALEINGSIEVGAVYDPVMKELFYAEKGKGATRNNESIYPIKQVSMKDALLVVDWGNKDGVRQEGLSYFQKFFVPEMIAKRIVPQFAPALGLCKVAEGRIHGLICNDTWIEDHAAGSLILQEAGGQCTNFIDTHTFSHRTAGIISACNNFLHEELVHFLKND